MTACEHRAVPSPMRSWEAVRCSGSAYCPPNSGQVVRVMWDAGTGRLDAASLVGPAALREREGCGKQYHQERGEQARERISHLKLLSTGFRKYSYVYEEPQRHE